MSVCLPSSKAVRCRRQLADAIVELTQSTSKSYIRSPPSDAPLLSKPRADERYRDDMKQSVKRKLALTELRKPERMKELAEHQQRAHIEHVLGTRPHEPSDYAQKQVHDSEEQTKAARGPC